MVIHMDTATPYASQSLRPRLATLIRMDNRSSGDAFNRAIVEQLRTAAASSGKSYWEIADESGISRATLARLFAVNTVARQSDLKMAYVYSLCRVLGLDMVGVISRAEQHLADEAARTAPRRPRKLK
jgi:AraC-like DNA-binding protein